jgi:eukaryotic-like serine/threonine-protein kinase
MRASLPASDTSPASPTAPYGYVFDEFKIDVATRKLWRCDAPVPLPSRAFDALLYLVEHRDRLVPKNELIDAIWNEVVVTDDSLIHAISVLRRALQDERRHPKYVETVPRRGYRFVGAVRNGAESNAAAVSPHPARPQDDSATGAVSQVQLVAEPKSSAAEVASGVDPTPPSSEPRVRSGRARLASPGRLGSPAAVVGAVAIMIAAVVVAVVLAAFPRARDGGTSSVRLFQPSPLDATITSGGVLSPDGRSLAFVARDHTRGKTALWVRSLSSNELRPLAGTEGAAKPFWSPDSRELGFFANGKVMATDLTGSVPRVIAAADLALAGGSWGPDGTILFAVWASGLYAVPGSGDGPIETIVTLDAAARDIAVTWPQFLPDGRRFLYQVTSLDPARTGTYVTELGKRESSRLLATQSAAIFAAPHHLLHVQNDMLIAEEIDLGRLELTGRATVVSRDISAPSLGADNVVSAAAGLLAFRHGVRKQNLAWFDRAGKSLGTLATPTVLFNPRVSPDDEHVLATSSVTDDPGLWIASASREEFARLETDGIAPLWSPDGNRVAFTSRGGFDMLVRAIDRSDTARLLLSDDAIKILNDWSPNAEDLVFTRIEDRTNLDLWTVRADGSAARPLLATPANEHQARISPDGRWIAYTSNESGVLEVYVERYPELGQKRAVSVGGGGQPQWRADQSELFYMSADRALMAVDVAAGNDIMFGSPRELFQPPLAGDPGDARDHYAATADGSRFLIDGPNEDAADPAITVIVNWTADASPTPRAAKQGERISQLAR